MLRHVIKSYFDLKMSVNICANKKFKTAHVSAVWTHCMLAEVYRQGEQIFDRGEQNILNENSLISLFFGFVL